MASPWRFVPVHSIEPVHPAANQRARGGLRRWWRRLTSDSRRTDEPTPDEERLQPLQAERLDALVPEPPRDAQRAALHTVFGRYERALLLRPVHGSWDPPFDELGGVDQDVPWPPDDPPFRAGLPDAMVTRLHSPERIHVTRLEHWYLRHHDGLGALRTLLAHLGEREGPWSADVSAWTWSWMQRVLPEVRALPGPLAAAPLSGEALAEWVAPPADVRLRGGGDRPDAGVFHALSTRARGDAGVAAAILRACLRDGAERAREDETDADHGSGPGVVWMRHPSDVDLPTTDGLGRDDLIVLHAVLVHGGATPATLRRALPFGDGVAGSAAAEMEGRDLLALDGHGRYRVRPAALPAVRARLQSEAFLLETA